MKRQWISVIMILSLILTMQVTAMGELGDLGANWEHDTFGANISFYHESNKNQGDYTLGEEFVFLCDTYCSGAKDAQGQRELSVTAYEGTSAFGIQSVEYKDNNVWKDISGYNTQISFRNDVDRYFRVVFIKEGTYVIKNEFLSNDHTVYVGCKVRYVTIKDGKFTISFDEPNISEDSQDTFIEGYQISTANEGFRVIASTKSEIQGQKVKRKGILFGFVKLGGTTNTGITDADMIVDSNSYYVYPVDATESAKITVDGASRSMDYYAMIMKFGEKNVSAFTGVYAVRSYAELEDGTYVYSNVYHFSVFNIAKKLYEESMMYTKEMHNYLYENILVIASPEYERKEYEQKGGIVFTDFN